MTADKLRVLDLFCGPGGFSTGFEAAGFETVGAFDKDKWAVKTFSANHKVSAVSADLDNYDMSTMPDVDVIIGGPPCTQFSSAKSNRTRNVLDGLSLVQAFLRCVYLKKPRYWIMENVPTIQKYLPGSIPLRWIGIDEDGELNIPQKVELIAADYGVPQRRKRYLIGNFPLPKKTHRNPLAKDFFTEFDLPVWKSMGDAMYGLPSPLTEANRSEYVDPNYDFAIPLDLVSDHFYDPSLSSSEARSIERAKTQHPYMGLLAWPDNLDEPARTVVATQLGRETLIIEDELGPQSRYRRASVRECAAMQSFPASYQFFGSSYGVKYRLVGDAVPPLMSFAIAKRIAELEGIEVDKPTVNSAIRETANYLGQRIERKKRKISTKRNVSVMLPSKEVRGARSEFFNDGYVEEMGEYEGLIFNLPKWSCRLVLGEGAKSTKKFDVDGQFERYINSALFEDSSTLERWERLLKALTRYIESVPKNSVFYGRHCLSIEEGSTYGVAEEIGELVENEFPKSEFHKKFIDLSALIEHPKSTRVRVRVAIGCFVGRMLSNHLNQRV